MTAKNAKKPVCFVISPIGDKGTEIRKHADMVLGSIIRPALEDTYDVKRSDEFGKSEMITPQIVRAIDQSAMAVAVLTTLNPNVFYELGLRHLAKRAVVHLAQEGTELPFDNAGMATIFYDISDYQSHIATRRELRAHVAEITAEGHHVSNPVTVAQAFTKAIESGNDEQVLVANLVSEVARLGSELQSLKQQQSRGVPLDSDTGLRLSVKRMWNNAELQRMYEESAERLQELQGLKETFQKTSGGDGDT